MNARQSCISTAATAPATPSVAARNIFVSRQPIYDQQLHVFAYALAGHNPEEAQHDQSGSYPATSELIYSAFIESGLDVIVGHNRALIRLSRGFLLLDYAHAFPKDKVILEVSDITPVDKALIEAVCELSAEGYAIALNDMIDFDHPQTLIETAELITIDLSACPRPQLEARVDYLRQYGVKLLASKVETQEELAYCKELGFDYFQGYFICQPETVKQHRSPTNRLAVIHLMAKLLHPEADIDELEAIVSRDVSLSYKLLRLINSSFYGLRNKIDSIRQALLLLGLKTLTTWVSLILLSGIDDKPQELTVTAMVRAKMCELLAREMAYERPQTFFFVGLLSILDALMDTPMFEVLVSLPLDDDVVQALLHYEGILGLTLRSVLAYERGNWDEVYHLGVDGTVITDAYLQAVVWAEASKENL